MEKWNNVEHPAVRENNVEHIPLCGRMMGKAQQAIFQLSIIPVFSHRDGYATFCLSYLVRSV